MNRVPCTKTRPGVSLSRKTLCRTTDLTELSLSVAWEPVIMRRRNVVPFGSWLGGQNLAPGWAEDAAGRAARCFAVLMGLLGCQRTRQRALCCPQRQGRFPEFFECVSGFARAHRSSQRPPSLPPPSPKNKRQKQHDKACEARVAARDEPVPARSRLKRAERRTRSCPSEATTTTPLSLLTKAPWLIEK